MGLTVVPTSAMCQTPGQRDAAVDADGPGLSPGHTDGQGCRGGGHSTAERKSSSQLPPPGLLQAQGYSRPRVTPDPALLRSSRSFFPFPPGILTIQGPYSALGWLRTPCCPQPHSPRDDRELASPFPVCRPLPSAAAGVPAHVSSGQAHVDSDMGSVSLALRHSPPPVILGLPHPPGREEGAPRDTSSP